MFSGHHQAILIDKKILPELDKLNKIDDSDEISIDKLKLPAQTQVEIVSIFTSTKKHVDLSTIHLDLSSHHIEISTKNKHLQQLKKRCLER